MKLDVRPVVRVRYAACLAAMRELVESRARGSVIDTLLLVEHEGVYTRGRRDSSGDIVAPGIDVVDVERGGRITWHGPGQLVAYPVVALQGKARDLHAWLRLLEDATIDCLRSFGVAGVRDPSGTGVFTGNRKIASIGIAVRRWVTYHGVAINVACDLGAFAAIAPCGFDASVMTSIARELGGASPTLTSVGARFAEAFEQRLAAFCDSRELR